MNNQDAKFHLTAYRPGGADAHDPTMIGALEQARNDPSLRVWFEREQAHDAAVAAKLQSIVPPAELRAAILAGARVSRTRSWWRQPQWMGLAAALVLLAAVSGLWLRSLPTAAGPGAGGVIDLAGFALRELSGSHNGGYARAGTELDGRLQGEAPRLSAGLALSPEELRAAGCHVFNVGGVEVFEVCFKRDQSSYHLYLTRRSDARVEPGDEHPMQVTRRDGTALTWADERYVYVLAGRGEGADLRPLL